MEESWRSYGRTAAWRVGIHDAFSPISAVIHFWQPSLFHVGHPQEDVPYRRIFEVPTVAGLAEAIAERTKRREARRSRGNSAPADPIWRTGHFRMKRWGAAGRNAGARKNSMSQDHAHPISNFRREKRALLNPVARAQQPNNVRLIRPGASGFWNSSRRAPVFSIDTAVRACDWIPVVERSINEIVRRHETLRTTFTAVDGQPIQVIAPSLFVPVPVVDLARSEADRRAEHSDWQRSATAIRPGRRPLIRTTLFAWLRFCFPVDLHHIISDGWSMGCFPELTALLSVPVGPIATARCRCNMPIMRRGSGNGSEATCWMAASMEDQLAALRPPTSDRSPGLPFQRMRADIRRSNGLHIAAPLELSQREGVTFMHDAADRV
jgi:hypothetical protein